MATQGVPTVPTATRPVTVQRHREGPACRPDANGATHKACYYTLLYEGWWVCQYGIWNRPEARGDQGGCFVSENDFCVRGPIR